MEPFWDDFPELVSMTNESDPSSPTRTSLVSVDRKFGSRLSIFDASSI